MSEVRIRVAEPRDLPRVAELWSALVASEQALGAALRVNEHSPQQWLASFERHLGRFAFLWVAEQEGEVRGYLLARLRTVPAYVGGELAGEISSIFVDEAIRRRGSGEQLVRIAIDTLGDAGARAIEVEAHECNPDARTFWEAQGFATAARTYRLAR